MINKLSFQEIDVGFVSHIYAMRLTHTGEDGFMLYIPSEVKFIQISCFLKLTMIFFQYALCVYDILMEQGKDYGIINAGQD